MTAPTSAAPEAGVAASAAPRFDAFISYSRADTDLAAALEQALERYRPPKGIGPSRRLRVFRDQDDLAGPSYGPAIEAALEASDRLIVVCSPDARRSTWVDDEIRRFLARKGPEAVVPVLASGIPNGAGEPDNERNAFPEALIEAMGIPLATDFLGFDPAAGHRPERAPYAGSWSALLATLLGVSREEVEERDRLRRGRTLRRVLTASGTLLAVMAALTTWALLSAAAERRARFDAQSRLLEARAVAALDGQEPELQDPTAALLMAREALAVAQFAEEGRRVPGAETVLHTVMTGAFGRGLSGWQDPIPRQTAWGPWSAVDPEGRALVTGDVVASVARLWDLTVDQPGTTGMLLDDTHAAMFLGDWVVGVGSEGRMHARHLDAPRRVIELSSPDGRYPRAHIERLAGRPGRAVAFIDRHVFLLEAGVDSITSRAVVTFDDWGAVGVARGRWVVGPGEGGITVVDLDTPGDLRAGVDGWKVLRDAGVAAVEMKEGFDTSIQLLDGNDGRILRGELAPDESWGVRVGGGGALAVWSPDGIRDIESAREPWQLVDEHVVAAHREGGVGFWRVTPDEVTLVHHWPDLSTTFSVSPGGEWLVSAPPGEWGFQVEDTLASDESRLFPLGEGLEVGRGIPIALPPGAGSVVFPPGGRWMVALGHRSHRLLSLDGARDATGYEAPIGAASWVDAPGALYTAHSDGRIRRWTRGEHGDPRSVEVVSMGPDLASLFVSPDERWLLGEPGAGGLGLWERTPDGGFVAVAPFSISVDQYWALDWRVSAGVRGTWEDLAFYAGAGPPQGGGRPARTLDVRFEVEPANALLLPLAAGGWLRWSLDDPGAAPVEITGPSTGPAPKDPAVGEDIRCFADDGNYRGARPVFSPDGRWVSTWMGLWDLDAPTRSGSDVSPGSSAGATGVAEEDRGCALRPADASGSALRQLRLEDGMAWPDIGGGSLIAGQIFDPTGRWLVARYSYRGYAECGYGSYFQLVDLAAEDPLRGLSPLRDHQSLDCPEVQFSPDGTWLATGRLLWALTDPQPTARPVTLPGEVLEFSPDGGTVAVQVQMGATYVVRLLPLDPARLLDEACLHAGRNPSPEEWRVAFPGEAYRTLCEGLPLPHSIEAGS